MGGSELAQRDKDFIVTFKELDHIQAIIGRYDSFFFLLKQLTLGGVFAFCIAGFERGFTGVLYATLIPIVFFIFEISFRYFYWSNFILRISEIERYLNGEEGVFRLYDLNRQFSVPKRLRISFHKFDMLFYSSIIIAVILLSIAIGFAALQLPATG